MTNSTTHPRLNQPLRTEYHLAFFPGWTRRSQGRNPPVDSPPWSGTGNRELKTKRRGNEKLVSFLALVFLHPDPPLRSIYYTPPPEHRFPELRRAGLVQKGSMKSQNCALKTPLIRERWASRRLPKQWGRKSQGPEPRPSVRPLARWLSVYLVPLRFLLYGQKVLRLSAFYNLRGSRGRVKILAFF